MLDHHKNYLLDLPLKYLFDHSKNIDNFFSPATTKIIQESNAILSKPFLSEQKSDSQTKMSLAKAIVHWVFDLWTSTNLGWKIILTTHFGPFEACLLHLAIDVINNYNDAEKKKISRNF